ncbi:MAG TPA: hypothetical protein VIH35_10135, partial [Kiritimatiellia bacterium]
MRGACLSLAFLIVSCPGVFFPAARAATYNAELDLQSGLGTTTAVYPVTNRAGHIWYQWRKTDFTGDGDTWMKFEWNFYGIQVGANIFGAGVD